METSSQAGLSNAVVVAIVAAVLIAVVVALSAFTKIAQHARETEGKNNLHAIQVALEKYGTDHQGQYPLYLIGGEARYAAREDPSAAAGRGYFAEITECPDLAQVSDPMLRAGCLTAYPRNPFVASGRSVHQAQLELPAWPSAGDPLRNFKLPIMPWRDWWTNEEQLRLAMRQGNIPEGRLGTRFGARCDLMGQVLADPRFPTLQVNDPAAKKCLLINSHANVEYPFYDVWGSYHKPYLPGEFFYKGSGMVDYHDARLSETQPLAPSSITQYMLGLYGAPRTKGKDVLANEMPIFAGWLVDGKPVFQNPNGELTQDLLIWLWTRSTNEPFGLGGSPFSDSHGELPYWEPMYGNSNGIRDGIILVLTTREDYSTPKN